MNANLSLTLSIILNSYMRCIFIVRLNTDLYCPLLKAKPYILRASACDVFGCDLSLQDSIKWYWVNGANQILLLR